MGMMSESGTEATAEAGESGNEFTVVDLLVCIIQSHKPGDSVSVTVLRNGDRKQFTVHLGKRG